MGLQKFSMHYQKLYKIGERLAGASNVKGKNQQTVCFWCHQSKKV